MNIFKRIMAYFYGKSKEYYYERRYLVYRKKYNIKTNFKFNGTDIRIYGEGGIELGNNSYVGSFSTFQLTTGTKIKIGVNCHISHNVRMYTASNIADQDFNIDISKKMKMGNIIIEDGVWIGANVFINPGITIGKNSVIGANSVVTIDIPSNSIAAGLPTRVLKTKTLN